MNLGILVPGEPDVTKLARLLRLAHCLQRAALRENPIHIALADDLVELHQIDVIDPQPPERLVDLLRGGRLVASVDLRHQKRFVAIAVRERFSHANLTHPFMIVPAVVHEIDPAIDGCANEADALLLVALHADMVATEPDERDFLAGAPERAARHAGVALRGPQTRAAGHREARGERHFHKIAAPHAVSVSRGESLAHTRLSRAARAQAAPR